MSTSTSSMERAFRDQAGDAGVALGVQGDAEQLDLLRDEKTGRLPGDVFRKMRIAAKDRGAGRPPGAGNKVNKDLAKLICNQHGNPVLFMASTYSMPLDQLCELLLIAEGTGERESALIRLADEMTRMIADARKSGLIDSAKIEKFSEMAERLESSATALKSKPGEIALKALGLQLAAANNTAPYVEKKMPIAVDHTITPDATIYMPADARQKGAADGFQQTMNNTFEALDNGTLRVEDLRDIRVVEGRLMRNGAPIDGGREDSGE